MLCTLLMFRRGCASCRVCEWLWAWINEGCQTARKKLYYSERWQVEQAKKSTHQRLPFGGSQTRKLGPDAFALSTSWCFRNHEMVQNQSKLSVKASGVLKMPRMIRHQWNLARTKKLIGSSPKPETFINMLMASFFLGGLRMPNH